MARDDMFNKKPEKAESEKMQKWAVLIKKTD